MAIAGLIALAASIGIGRFAFTPLLPMMQHDTGLTITAGGWLASANYLGYFAGAMSVVWLRLPAPKMVRIAMVLNVLLIAGMGVTDSVVAWLVIRAASGVASAWIFVFATAVVLKYLVECGRIGLSSVMFTGVGVGMAVSGILCIGFVANGVSARHAWLAFAAIVAIAAIAVWPLFSPAPETAPRDRARVSRAPRWTSTMASQIASYGLFGFGYIIPATFLPVIARDLLAGSYVYAWFWPVCATAAAVSVAFSAVWSRRFGDYALLVACCLSEAAGIALPVFTSHPLAIGVSAVLVGGTFVVITVAALREARRLAPAHAEQLIAAMTASFALGQIGGPIAAAHLVEASGNFDAALLLAAGALLGAVALLPKSTRAHAGS
jgi:MFS family permease